AEDVDGGVQAEDMERAAGASDAEVVVALGAVDGDRIGQAVAIGRVVQGNADLGQVGAGEVVDVDGVSAPLGAQFDILNAVQVHGDIAEVAGEEDVAAVGGEIEVLVDVGAEEEQCVVPALSFDGVATVARVPFESVVAGPYEGDVVAPI